MDFRAGGPDRAFFKIPVTIVVVVIWVLGAMWVFGVSYNMTTALITALTIGIGVDYTIHLTHRFLEEEKESDRVSDVLRRTMLSPAARSWPAASSSPSDSSQTLQVSRPMEPHLIANLSALFGGCDERPSEQ